MMWRGRILFLAAALAVAMPAPARACDICAVYSAIDLRTSSTGVRVGIAQQYARFTRVQDAGRSTGNPGNEKLDSSITQFLLAYQPRADVSFQANVPLISRHYRRFEKGSLRSGNETGVGDIVFSGRYQALSHSFAGGQLRAALLAGVEVPSGDTGPLREEPRASEIQGPWRRPRHVEDDEPSIHGHDLALGSGSVDGLVGGDVFLQYDRYHAIGTIQYRIRSEGDYEYRYDNELAASLGVGMFLLADERMTLSVRPVVTVESKGKDHVAGAVENDTAFTGLYAGPWISLTWGASLLAEVGADIPAIRNNSGVQIVPDFRVRGALTWRFDSVL